MSGQIQLNCMQNESNAPFCQYETRWVKSLKQKDCQTGHSSIFVEHGYNWWDIVYCDETIAAIYIQNQIESKPKSFFTIQKTLKTDKLVSIWTKSPYPFTVSFISGLHLQIND